MAELRNGTQKNTNNGGPQNAQNININGQSNGQTSGHANDQTNGIDNGVSDLTQLLQAIVAIAANLVPQANQRIPLCHQMNKSQMLDTFCKRRPPIFYGEPDPAASEGTRTVTQYAARFEELACHAGDLIKTDDAKARRFEWGLDISMRGTVMSHDFKTYTQVLKCALIIERESLDSKGKGKVGGPNTGGPIRTNNNQNNNRGHVAKPYFKRWNLFQI
ncbi:hypothetical protein Vadar_032497 [Vaccinium darrowii]|uniref:Uncharacterized protein n=1 Tax=Vaccinium darrowii TaxID=229202 RepID=A0ACB7XV43_9ERIC|nr:hypothetical protein Vadar_032497 [Vaccinium darrowii]